MGIMSQIGFKNTMKVTADRIAITVIIPTLNEGAMIERCLTALVRQSLPADQFEVIVVDNGSADRTVGIAQAFETSLNLTILKRSKCHISALRNLGAVAASGEFLAFLDADCIASSEWLSQAIKLLAGSDGGVIGAFYSVPENSSWLARAWYQDMAMKKGPVSYVPSGTLFVSRRVFSQMEGFDVNVETSEDFEFCQRVAAAGYGVLAFPALSTLHLGTPQNLSSFYRKQRWHGTGVRTVFLRDVLHPGFAKTVVQTMYSLFWLIGCVIALPLALYTGETLVIVVPPAFLLGGAFALAATVATRRKRWRYAPQLTLLFLVYGLARSLSFLGLSGTRLSSGVVPLAYGAGSSGGPNVDMPPADREFGS
jgi:cellulose synthase/poly-beta-1,6-N-acetylglucosamine synthase-like glycosyltransferase